jgi:hypothetical protein
MRRKMFWARFFMMSASLMVMSGVVGATTFTTIADSNTIVPGTSQTFAAYAANSVHYDGTAVSFIGGGTSVFGLYAGVSSLSDLVDETTTVPGTTVPFGYMSGADYTGGNFVLEGGTASTSPGIYYTGSVSRPLITLADTTTTLPGNTVTFTGFGNLPAISSTGAVAFIGTSTKTSPTSGGIYSDLGATTLYAVADTNTTLPGGSTKFTEFDVPAIAGNTLVYGGSSATETGLFLQTGSGSPSVIANQSTPVPNGTGDFTSLAGPSTDGVNVAFWGEHSSTSNQGIYALVNGQLVRIADTTVGAPGGGTFTGFSSDPGISGDEVIFEAGLSLAGSKSGIYLSSDGVLSKIIETGDTLDGRVVSSLNLSDNSFANSSVAFEASFTDGSSGVFLATIPEPGTISMFVPILLLALRRYRR